MRKFSVRLVPLVLAVMTSPALGGSISGTVLDRTANRPAPKVEVLLFRPESPEPIDRVVSDGKGGFSFPQVAPGEYVLGASHLGVPYVRRGVRVSDGAPHATADLQVYQSTTDSSAVSLEEDHVILQPEENGARVIEIVVYNNSGNRTYLGETTPASPTGNRLVVPLPEGYADLDGPEGLRDRIASHTETGVDLVLPLHPGRTQVALTYRLPGGSLGLNLARSFPFRVKSVSLLIPESGGWRVWSRDLRRMRKVNLQDKQYRIASGGPFPAGRVVSARAYMGLLGTGISPRRAAWGGGGLLVAALSLAWILRRARSVPGDAAMRAS